ncbi:MAG: S1 RNA-binding domain-containing protein, partial [Sphingobacteriales bacterium]
FLRIRDAANPLDNSSVHPETYPVVKAMAADLNCEVKDLIQNGDLRKQLNRKKYITETVGELTINDIFKELEKPGRDPRQQIEEFRFDENVKTMDDLKPGMKIPGIVTNITNFGAFVDIGVKQDGLVHISQLSNTFVSDPNQVVKLQQKVMVTVTEVDPSRKRIALTMKDASSPAQSGGGDRRPPAAKPQGGGKPGAKAAAAAPMNPFQAKLAELKKKMDN